MNDLQNLIDQTEKRIVRLEAGRRDLAIDAAARREYTKAIKAARATLADAKASR